MRIRAGFIAFATVIQSILFLTHFFIYKTWMFAPTGNGASAPSWLKVTMWVMSGSFLVATLLAFRYSNPALRAFYRISAVWLGIVSFLFFAAVASWVVFGLGRLAGGNANFHAIVESLYAVAVLSGFTGVLNAGWTRIRRITVRLENLPEAWRGRKAALISDLHLGHVRNGGFLRRIVAKVMREKPDAVFSQAICTMERLSMRRRPLSLCAICARHEEHTLWREITNNSVTIRKFCKPSATPVFACCTMRKWKRTNCRSWACPTITPRMTSISGKCCGKSALTGIGPASC